MAGKAGKVHCFCPLPENLKEEFPYHKLTVVMHQGDLSEVFVDRRIVKVIDEDEGSTPVVREVDIQRDDMVVLSEETKYCYVRSLRQIATVSVCRSEYVQEEMRIKWEICEIFHGKGSHFVSFAQFGID